jgi:hypothetical protein
MCTFISIFISISIPFNTQHSSAISHLKDMEPFEVEKEYMSPIRERINLAKKVDKISISHSKQKKSDDWFIRSVISLRETKWKRSQEAQTQNTNTYRKHKHKPQERQSIGN